MQIKARINIVQPSSTWLRNGERELQQRLLTYQAASEGRYGNKVYGINIKHST